MLLLLFSPGISPSVWSCRASSSGFVRIGAYEPFRSEVSYVSLFVVSGISSSSSSSSVSVSVFLRFCTIFSLPLSMSRKISSQRPSFPSSPRRHCLFFGWISFSGSGICSRLDFFSVWKNGPEINFQLIIFPVSVFTVFSVPLIAVWILFWNFPSSDFLLWFFFTNWKG